MINANNAGNGRMFKACDSSPAIASGVSPHSDFEADLISLLPDLRRRARSFVRSREDAEDLTQDTVVRALHYRDKFEAGSNLRAWLFTVMRNVHFNARQRKAPVSTVSLDMEETAGFLPVTPADQESGLLQRDLRAAISDLPEKQRTTFRLVAAGLSYDQAAASVGCAVGTIKSQLSRARAALVEAAA